MAFIENEGMNMALIKCSECQSEISKSAAFCPQCGKPLKKKSSGLGCLVALILSALVVWGIYETSVKTELRAKVSISANSVAIVNGNDIPWKKLTIHLNNSFDGPILDINENWPPGERKELNFREFKGQINRQAFNPEFEKVSKIIIEADGFQLGIYK
jgi:hypothetical protein